MPERFPSFRTQLQQKLVMIFRVYSKTEAAKIMGCTTRSLSRWQLCKPYPGTKWLEQIDQCYLMAAEILANPGLMEQRKKTSAKIRSIAQKLKLNHGAVKALQAEGLY